MYTIEYRMAEHSLGTYKIAKLQMQLRPSADSLIIQMTRERQVKLATKIN